jgi:uncharacterized protein (TIGR02145 family)
MVDLPIKGERSGDMRAELVFGSAIQRCIRIAIACAVVIAFSNCSEDKSKDKGTGPSPQPTGTVTDVDGNTYRTVKIGNQWWMAENLKVKHYRTGAAIPSITDNATWENLASGGHCAYDNEAGNVATYGLLYNWYAAVDSRNIAPDGWHVPSRAEWEILQQFLGGEAAAGGKMKESGTTHWASPNTGATNESGFTALPGGDRISTGYFAMKGHKVVFWASTSYSSENAWSLNIDYDNSGGRISTGFGKRWGFSVRCVKD